MWCHLEWIRGSYNPLLRSENERYWTNQDHLCEDQMKGERYDQREDKSGYSFERKICDGSYLSFAGLKFHWRTSTIDSAYQFVHSCPCHACRKACKSTGSLKRRFAIHKYQNSIATLRDLKQLSILKRCPGLVERSTSDVMTIVRSKYKKWCQALHSE